MKPNSDKFRNLLHEVLPFTANYCGPTFADVQHLVHEERRRRSRLRANTVILAALAVLLSAVFWRDSAPKSPPAALGVSKPASVVIRQVNDEQLFALLKDTPAALIKSPDGTSRLLVLDQ